MAPKRCGEPATLGRSARRLKVPYRRKAASCYGLPGVFDGGTFSWTAPNGVANVNAFVAAPRG